MKNYIEITLLPEAKINVFDLWSKLLTQIHLGLVSIQDDDKKSPVGISFPEYFMGKKFGIIGSKLRLFAMEESDLIRLDAKKWLSRLSDYIHITNIRRLPEKIDGYAIFNRYQPKINKERLARRYAKRHNLTYEEAIKHYENMKKKEVIEYPFIRLKSLSSKNEFRLNIQKTSSQEFHYEKFSTYGLSEISTLPEF